MSVDLYYVTIDVTKTYSMYVKAENKDDAIEAGYELYYDLEPNYDFVDVHATKEYGTPSPHAPTWSGGVEGAWES